MTTLSHLLPRSRRPLHLRLYLLLGLAIIATLLASTTSAVQASTPILHGYRDFSYPSNVGQKEITSAKPESKLWWNDGHWWGNIWSTTGNSYHIFRLDLATQTWIDTGVPVDPRTDSKADALWDGSQLYIVSHIFDENTGPADPGDEGKLYKYTYDAAGDTYSLEPGFPVNVNQSVSETLVLAKDTTGTLWVTYVAEDSGNSQVMVNHTTGNDATWGTPYQIPVAGAGDVGSDDISSIIAYDGYIGVMWSDQSGGRSMSFAGHADGDGDAAADWQVATAYNISGDDHINLKSLHADASGKVFAAIKTSNSSALIVLLVCDTGDCTTPTDWDFYNVYNSDADPTRPMMMIDEDNRDLYIFARVKDIPGGDGEIYYKKASIDSISFDPSSAGVPFIATDSGESINDPTSTKQNVNSATGLVILASDEEFYFHNYLDLSTPDAPTITSFTPQSGTAGTEVTITGSNFTGATAVRFNGTPAVSFTIDSDNQIQATVPAGATTGLISVTNPDGTGSSATHFTVIVAPSITSFTPPAGPVGTEVTLTGAGFAAATAVNFNGTAASFDIDSDNQIRATVPAGATTGPISVTNAVGTGSSATNFTVTVAPSITSFTPPAGPVGTEVTITGTSFSGVTAVGFNGTAALSFTIDSNTQIRATVPAGATTGPISVTNAAGTGSSATHFIVTVAPGITSFTPLEGPVGTEVTITGAGFAGVTTVDFNGTPAVQFTLDSGAQIRAIVPAGATTGPISVTNAAGTATSAANFTVLAPLTPTISGFTPTSGPVGTPVTITGTDFGEVTEVRFNGAPAGFIVDSDTQIRASVPAGATTGPISVTNPAGSATSAASFEVVVEPVEHLLFLPYVGAPQSGRP